VEITYRLPSTINTINPNLRLPSEYKKLERQSSNAVYSSRLFSGYVILDLKVDITA